MKTVARKSWSEPVYETDDTGRSVSSEKFAGYVEHVNDIMLDQRGNIMMYDGSKGVSDRVDAAVKTQLGELQLNINVGVPYEETIFKNRRFAQRWVAAMREAILRDSEVATIEKFDYEIVGDVLKYTVVFTTTYGTTETVTYG